MATLGDGTIIVNEKVTPTGPQNLDQIVLPRIGVKMYVNKALDRVTYYGRGPYENYNDRMRGSFIGRYTSTVKEQLPPYVSPMEGGNHEDVRWWALTNAKGAGLIRLDNDLTKWLPGDDILVDTPICIPNLEPGTYRIRVGVLDPFTDKPAIKLAIKGRTEDWLRSTRSEA